MLRLEEAGQRILAAAERWPELPAASITIISSASSGYVTEVLKARENTGSMQATSAPDPDWARNEKQHWAS